MTEYKPIEYVLLPKQYEFLYGIPYEEEQLDKLVDDNGLPMTYVDVSLYQGGVGSGKTFCGSLRGLMFALEWAGCKGLVGAMSQDLLDTTTKEKYLDHMKNIGLKEGVHWWFEDRKSTIKFLNGSEIRFKTLSDWRQFMSTEYTWIEFEEASFIEEIVFKKLISRLREFKRPEWKNYYRSLFMHTNPQGKRGWLNRLFINPKTRKASYRYVTASTRENHHLGSEYVDLLEDLYSEDEISEMIEGLDNENDSTVAFPRFTSDNVKKLEFNPAYPIILSCDFNYNPMCWYVMQEINGVWYVIKELIECNITTKEMCKQIQPYIDSLRSKRLIIMGDAHGRDRKTNGSDYSVMTSHFSQLGYNVELRVQKANPLIKDRLAVLRGFIKNAKGIRKLFIDESCTWLLYNFEECKNNLGNAGLKIPTDSEIQADSKKLYMIHPIDAVSYPIYFLNSLRDIAGEQVNL